ncbi:hypothetical protein EYZ11_000335 [Aspergillus tanneri]|uniref:Uncharacterized protein n=1 Tax=Aspergillus tanneri TaxID=1220188 RepID=A0A4S3JXP8_9EURO|nr:uncharacterized protein ATNIH1004_004314 [Aspergillus tanneri]KAA8648429.1 hypothetical protein ATNIH1004_004314 [Aspergillus tanneri]THD00144.1 hypothetical protein EYZ11_000335 [Aspergillus tanneri]
MPATVRPNTDYERWLRESNPEHKLAPEPDYGANVRHDSQMESSLEYKPPFSEPQIYFSRDDPVKRFHARSPFSTACIIPIFVVLVAIIFVKTRRSRELRPTQSLKPITG